MAVRISPREITPEHVYLNRRAFLKVAGSALLTGTLAACGVQPQTQAPARTPVPGKTDELGDPITPYEITSNYNNYYEFSTDKRAVARLARDFPTDPWTIEVTGLVKRPFKIGLEDLLREFPQEERIYRLRCVEGWSVVVPWQGFPLAKLLARAEPTSEARYVRFVSIYKPEAMPGQRKYRTFPWPYTEGLRLDEAMHPLTILATGMYGKLLPPQNGAPVRLVVPWKYGFKSIKAVVKIELVATQPRTFWNTVAPHEYGFYANVNPNVPHPRWSQATERRLGESGRRPTLMFNGYEEEVAYLYKGMDLRENY